VEIDAETWSAKKLFEHGSGERTDTTCAFRMAALQTPEVQGEFLQGRPIAVDDAAMDPRTASFAVALAESGTGALLGAPCVVAGRERFVLAVDKADVYHWRPHEIELVQDVATRTWAHIERARAESRLRESEAALHAADRQKDEFMAM